MLIVILGSEGQLGSEMVKFLQKGKDTVHAFGHAGLDITDFNGTRQKLETIKPDFIINCTAYNKVDDASANSEPAMKVNSSAVENLGLICRDINAVMVHFSTDYVFNGRKSVPYTETDMPAPLNSYGISKLLGENSIRHLLRNYYLIRTSGVYGKGGSRQKGGNFVETILKKSMSQPELRVVNDQTISPTYAKDLAEAACGLIKTGKFGLYHITNSGTCTWYEFARAIVDAARSDCRIVPVSSDEYPQRALRPKYSAMSSVNLSGAGIPALRHWKEALTDYLAAR